MSVYSDHNDAVGVNGARPALAWYVGEAPSVLQQICAIRDNDENEPIGDTICLLRPGAEPFNHNAISNGHRFCDPFITDTKPPIPLSGCASPALIWRYYDAPQTLQDLAKTPHGGDEDFLAVLPPGTEDPWWIENLATCDANTQTLDDGTILIVGGHS